MDPLFAWTPVERGEAKVKAAVALLSPLHRQNPNYLTLNFSGTGGEAGIANSGYDGGISVRAGAIYDFSLWARRSQGTAAPLIVALEAPDGTCLAQTELTAPGADWARKEAVLTGLATGTRFSGERILLTGAKDAKNDREQPDRIAPTTTSLQVESTFASPAPACSVQVIWLQPRRK